MATLDEWTELASRALAVPAPDRQERTVVLDVARDVAHNVVRPAAPLSAYLLGLAVGRGVPLDEAATTLVDLAQRAHEARTHEAEDGDAPS
jgi:hypothetical protein